MTTMEFASPQWSAQCTKVMSVRDGLGTDEVFLSLSLPLPPSLSVKVFVMEFNVLLTPRVNLMMSPATLVAIPIVACSMGVAAKTRPVRSWAMVVMATAMQGGSLQALRIITSTA